MSDVQVNGTSIASSGVANIVTKTAYNASNNKIATENDLPDISGKQDIIDSSHKLSADLISDGSTNKTVTATEKSSWSGKSVVSGTNDGTNWSTITIDGTTKNIPSGGGGGGTATDVQINGTSIVSNNTANILTNTAYNSSTNKIATMTDVNSKQDKIPVETSPKE